MVGDLEAHRCTQVASRPVSDVPTGTILQVTPLLPQTHSDCSPLIPQAHWVPAGVRTQSDQILESWDGSARIGRGRPK